MTKLLLIDDEALFREDLAALLAEEEDFTVVTASDAKQALHLSAEHTPDIVLCDLIMPDVKGAELIGELKIRCPDSLIIVLTSYGSVDSVIEAFRMGAADFVLKPIIVEDLTNKIRRFLSFRSTLFEVRRLRVELSAIRTPMNNFQKDSAMKKIYDLMKRVSQTDSTVLVSGESGTGKEVVSHAIHDMSRSCEGPFMAVNCTAIPESLFESELFGHVKGSFTGAVSDKKGYLSQAAGGTIFLDEIGELPLHIQSKLLRVLEEKEYTKVGSTQAVKLRARIIAATNRDLKTLEKSGKFRQDLYYRLNVFPIYVPPLRKRLAEIPYICDHFINLFNNDMNKKCKGVSSESLTLLMEYGWPGNIRELRNVLERAMILLDGDFIQPEHFMDLVFLDHRDKKGVVADNLKRAVQDFEKRLIVRIYNQSSGRKEETARRLGINPSTLYRKMSEYGIE